MVCGTIHSCDVMSCNVCILYLLMPKGVWSIININYVKRNLLWAKQNYIFCIIFFSTHFFSWCLGFDDRYILNRKDLTSHETANEQNNKIRMTRRKNSKKKRERDSMLENYGLHCGPYLTLKDENRIIQSGKL